jgi:hypothetical protein
LEPIRVEDYPDRVASPDGEGEFSVAYLHNPSDPADGITARLPLVELSHLPGWFGEWLVPGWLGEKVACLLRCLRKETRTLLPSNREVVEDFLAAWDGYEPACGLVEAMIDHLHEAHGFELTADSFDLDRMPEFLRMRFEILDDEGKMVGAGRDLEDLQESLAGRVRDRFATVARGKFENDRIGSWSFGDLPESVDLDRHTVGFPRLYDAGKNGPAMKLFSCATCAAVQHRLGVARLFLIENSELAKRLLDVLFSTPDPGDNAAVAPKSTARTRAKKKSGRGEGDFGSLSSAFGVIDEPKPSSAPAEPQPSPPAKQGSSRFLTRNEAWLLSHIGAEPERNRDDLVLLFLGALLGEPLTREEWDEACRGAGESLFDSASATCGRLRRLLAVVGRVGNLLESEESGYEESLADARDQFARLFAQGWLLVGDLPRRTIHLQGLETRLTRMLGAAPAKDLDKLERYRFEAATIWREDPSCECGLCPEAIVRAGQFAEDEDLRLKVFAPEVRARLK